MLSGEADGDDTYLEVHARGRDTSTTFGSDATTTDDSANATPTVDPANGSLQ